MKAAGRAASAAMSRALYDPKGSDKFAKSTDFQKIPNVELFDKLTKIYAKSFISIMKYQRTVTKRDVVQKKSEAIARHKTWTWAHNHAMKEADKADKRAEEVCNKSKLWIAEVRDNVKRRLAEVHGAQKSAKLKAETASKKWATKQMKGILKKRGAVEKAHAQALSKLRSSYMLKTKTLTMQMSLKIKSQMSKLQRVTAEYQKLKAKGAMRLKLAKETTVSRTKEAKKLYAVAAKEARRQQKDAAASYRASQLKLQADMRKTIDSYNSRKHKAIEQLKVVSGQLSIGADVAAARKKRSTMLAEAAQRERTALSRLKLESRQKTTTAISILKQQISKYQMKMKQEISATFTSIAKAKQAEKAERAKVDKLKADAKKGKASSLKDFMASATEKQKTMLFVSKKRQHADLKKAREIFYAKVKALTKKELPYITKSKKEYQAAFGEREFASLSSSE